MMNWTNATEYGTGTYSTVLLPFKQNRKVDEYDVLILCQLDIYFLKLSKAETKYLIYKNDTSLLSPPRAIP